MDRPNVEQAKYIRRLVADSMEEYFDTDATAKSSKNWFECQTCKVSTGAALTPVAGLINNDSTASQITELVKFIVALLDMDTADVELIVDQLMTAHELSKSHLVKALCKAMHAC